MTNHIFNEGYASNSNLFDKAIGSKVFIKNKKFIDLSFSAGSLILGHQSQIFKKSLKDLVLKKISILAAPNKQASEYSKILKKIFPSFSKFIFCSTGSEAVMKSIRLAKALTKKDLIVCVTGSWHGSNDKTLFTPNKINLSPIPMSDGLSEFDKSNIKFIPYNDEKKSEKILKKYKKNICCIIIEPIQAGLPDANSFRYLKFLDRFSKVNKKLLIFDETITGIRTNCSSVHQLYNLKPDITTFGKCLGGGMPIGVIGLTKNIEKRYKRKNVKVFFGGTFSGNSVSTYVGKETTKYIFKNKKKIFKNLNKKSSYFLQNIKSIIEKDKLNVSIYNFSSMFRLIFTKKKVKNRIQRDFFESKNAKKINLFRKFLLKNHIYYPSNGIIFISDQTSFKDLNEVIKVIKNGLNKFFKKD